MCTIQGYTHAQKHTHSHSLTATHSLFLTQQWGRTWLIDPAKGVSTVVLAGLEAVLTEVKVITVPALKPGAVDGKHLATITPTPEYRKENIRFKTFIIRYNKEYTMATVSKAENKMFLYTFCQ